MLKQIWTMIFGYDNDFFKYNIREKMALIIIFVLAIIILIKGVESETIKYVIVGLLAFLKGDKGPEQTNAVIQEQIKLAKEKEQPPRTIIVDKPNEQPKPLVEGEN